MKALPTIGVIVSLMFTGCTLGVDTIGLKLAKRTRFDIVWDRYSRLPGSKAFALAGDPAGINATGLVYGMSSGEEAGQKALDYCEEQRTVRRIEDPCALLAVDDNVIAAWLSAKPGRGA